MNVTPIIENRFLLLSPHHVLVDECLQLTIFLKVKLIIMNYNDRQGIHLN